VYKQPVPHARGCGRDIVFVVSWGGSVRIGLGATTHIDVEVAGRSDLNRKRRRSTGYPSGNVFGEELVH
jgi:hypothetical protein